MLSGFHVTVLVVYLATCHCRIIDETFLQQQERGRREAAAEGGLNYGSRPEAVQDVAGSSLPVYATDVVALESLGQRSTKQKRCPRTPPRLRAGQNNENLIGAPKSTVLQRRDTNSQTKEKLCESCLVKYQCKFGQRCEECKIFCAKPSPNDIDDPSPSIQSNDVPVASTSKFVNDVQVTLANRFSDTSKENHDLEDAKLSLPPLNATEHIYTVASFSSGPIKQLICKLLGISDSDIDRLVVWATTFSNKSPKFGPGFNDKISPQVKKLIRGFNLELKKALEQNKKQGRNFLSNEEMEKVAERVLAANQRDNGSPAETKRILSGDNPDNRNINSVGRVNADLMDDTSNPTQLEASNEEISTAPRFGSMQEASAEMSEEERVGGSPVEQEEALPDLEEVSLESDEEETPTSIKTKNTQPGNSKQQMQTLTSNSTQPHDSERVQLPQDKKESRRPLTKPLMQDVHDKLEQTLKDAQEYIPDVPDEFNLGKPENSQKGNMNALTPKEENSKPITKKLMKEIKDKIEQKLKNIENDVLKPKDSKLGIFKDDEDKLRARLPSQKLKPLGSSLDSLTASPQSSEPLSKAKLLPERGSEVPTLRSRLTEEKPDAGDDETNVEHIPKGQESDHSTTRKPIQFHDRAKTRVEGTDPDDAEDISRRDKPLSESSLGEPEKVLKARPVTDEPNSLTDLSSEPEKIEEDQNGTIKPVSKLMEQIKDRLGQALKNIKSSDPKLGNIKPLKNGNEILPEIESKLSEARKKLKPLTMGKPETSIASRQSEIDDETNIELAPKEENSKPMTKKLMKEIKDKIEQKLKNFENDVLKPKDSKLGILKENEDKLKARLSSQKLKPFAKSQDSLTASPQSLEPLSRTKTLAELDPEKHHQKLKSLNKHDSLTSLPHNSEPSDIIKGDLTSEKKEPVTKKLMLQLKENLEKMKNLQKNRSKLIDPRIGKEEIDTESPESMDSSEQPLPVPQEDMEPKQPKISKIDGTRKSVVIKPNEDIMQGYPDQQKTVEVKEDNLGEPHSTESLLESNVGKSKPPDSSPLQKPQVVDSSAEELRPSQPKIAKAVGTRKSVVRIPSEDVAEENQNKNETDELEEDDLSVPHSEEVSLQNDVPKSRPTDSLKLTNQIQDVPSEVFKKLEEDSGLEPNVVDNFDKAKDALKNVGDIVNEITKKTNIKLPKDLKDSAIHQTPIEEEDDGPHNLNTNIQNLPPLRFPDRKLEIPKLKMPNKPLKIMKLGKAKLEQPSDFEDEKVGSQPAENVVWDTNVPPNMMRDTNLKRSKTGPKLGSRMLEATEIFSDESKSAPDSEETRHDENIPATSVPQSIPNENITPTSRTRGDFQKVGEDVIEPSWSKTLGKLMPSKKGNKSSPENSNDMYFVGNGIKLPVQMIHKDDGAVHLSVDLEKLCSCNNATCPKNQTSENAALRKNNRDTQVDTSNFNSLEGEQKAGDVDQDVNVGIPTPRERPSTLIRPFERRIRSKWLNLKDNIAKRIDPQEYEQGGDINIFKRSTGKTIDNKTRKDSDESIFPHSNLKNEMNEKNYLIPNYESTEKMTNTMKTIDKNEINLKGTKIQKHKPITKQFKTLNKEVDKSITSYKLNSKFKNFFNEFNEKEIQNKLFNVLTSTNNGYKLNKANSLHNKFGEFEEYVDKFTKDSKNFLKKETDILKPGKNGFIKNEVDIMNNILKFFKTLSDKNYQ